MNDLILYKSETFQNNICDFLKNDNNEIFMTGRQLGRLLGYTYPNKAIRTLLVRYPYLKEMEFSRSVKLKPPYENQNMHIFTEDEIYEVAMLAKTEKALEFRAWVRKILKALRKKEIELLEKKIEENKPKVELFEQVINASNSLSMLQASKVLKITGRNSLFKLLRDRGILMSSGDNHNLTYQKYIDLQYFEVVLKPMLIGKKLIDISVTLVTPNGIEFIQKKIKNIGLQKCKAS